MSTRRTCKWVGDRWCDLTADDTDELHRVSPLAGIKRRPTWTPKTSAPHYDITGFERDRAAARRHRMQRRGDRRDLPAGRTGRPKGTVRSDATAFPADRAAVTLAAAHLGRAMFTVITNGVSRGFLRAFTAGVGVAAGDAGAGHPGAVGWWRWRRPSTDFLLREIRGCCLPDPLRHRGCGGCPPRNRMSSDGRRRALSSRSSSAPIHRAWQPQGDPGPRLDHAADPEPRHPPLQMACWWWGRPSSASTSGHHGCLCRARRSGIGLVPDAECMRLMNRLAGSAMIGTGALIAARRAGRSPPACGLSRIPSICALIPHTDFGVCREKSG